MSKHINKIKLSTKIFNILIVDDDCDTANSFGEILSSRHHNVTIINDVVTCISKCQNQQYDIIFMDFHMDKINGVELTELIKKLFNAKSLIFAFTGDDSNNAIQQFKNIGMNGAFIKPIDIDLINNFMNILEQRNNLDIKLLKTVKFLRRQKNFILFD